MISVMMSSQLFLRKKIIDDIGNSQVETMRIVTLLLNMVKLSFYLLFFFLLV